MKPRRSIAATATLLAAFAAAAVAAPSAAGAATGGYVALGDSYSSGVGAGSYTSESGDCHRSTKAYPQLWADANKPSSFTFAACSGARTGDVTSGQLGSLSSSTALVSISIGGNDVGFSDVMTTCVTSSDSVCLDKLKSAETDMRATLPAKLDSTYDAIRAKAPNAHVVVAGYPRFYTIGGDCVAGLSDTKRSAINDAADQLDSVIAKRVADHGFTFADVRDAFAPHELCGGSPWLHSVTLPVYESYHPTAAGQSGGYLPALTAAAK